MTGLLALLLPAADIATESRNIIAAMLIVGLVFVGVVALGELSRWLRHRRH